MSTWREKARAVLAPVIIKNIGRSRKEMRRLIAEVRPLYGAHGRRADRIWCEEVAIALHERSRRQKRCLPLQPSDCLPGLFSYVAQTGKGSLTACLDVDLPIWKETKSS